jgi:subtilisin family serine protease
VIVKLKGVEAVTASGSSAQAVQRADIQDASQSLDAIGGGYIEKVRDYTNLPYAVYTVDAAGEAALKADGKIENVKDDEIMQSFGDTPIPTIGGNAITGFSDGTTSYTGDGYAVAVVDTGVDKNHPALAGKVISEACFGMNATYSNVTLSSLCPGAATSSTASGSGQDCTLPGCGHGTMVAGAAGMHAVTFDVDGDSTPDNLSGTANDAKIVAVKIAVSASETSTASDLCGDGLGTLGTCGVPIESLYLAGLDYVANLSTSVPIAAANLSIGSLSVFADDVAQCDATSYESVAMTLRAHNIAPVVAAGNFGDVPSNYNKISRPACANGAIAVAATNVNGTALASYSNNGPLTDLLAPGGDYDGSNDDTFMWLPKNGTATLEGTQGTSFAAPTVAGAYAVLREAHPNATVDQLTALLQNTGTSITDNRSGYTVGAKKLIQLDAALAAAENPIISTFTGPSGTINEGVDITLNLAAANVTSCSLNNGIGAVTVTSTSTPKVVPAKASYTLTCQGAYGDTAVQTLNFTLNTAPSQPVNISGNGDKDARTFLVQWEASADGDGVANYQVYVNGALVATLNSSARSYLLSNVQYSQAYSIEVRAVDTLGAVSVASNLSFTLTSSGVVSPGVPNTGVAALKMVQPVQVIAMVFGGALLVLMLARRPAKTRANAKR